jgi:hypothetical protein
MLSFNSCVQHIIKSITEHIKIAYQVPSNSWNDYSTLSQIMCEFLIGHQIVKQ